MTSGPLRLTWGDGVAAGVALTLLGAFAVGWSVGLYIDHRFLGSPHPLRRLTRLNHRSN